MERRMKTKLIKKLDMVAEDMKQDAINFDGRPFNGKVVAEYFGYQGAAIAELANVMKSFLVNEQSKKVPGD